MKKMLYVLAAYVIATAAGLLVAYLVLTYTYIGR